MTIRTRLYLVTPPEIDLAAFPDRLSQALEAGDVACLQLRLKTGDGPADEAVIRKAVERLRPICHNHDVALILNDDPALAAELDCDGVHVGQEDTPYAEARQIVGPDAIVGVTCHNSRHLAMSAAEQGADYVAFGAFFPTHTKQAKTQADIELLSWWAELMEVPVVAIGGITVENCRPLVEAGADFLAVVGGVWNHKDGPAAAVSAFNRIFDEVEAAQKGGKTRK
ncbi:thiamine phosphate synthase [Oceanibaculum indicum]|uniref:thiamine phosphate synthase n=1 Tax=Oceanibaculum indicum TaxID=526216 RepID=UPI00059429BD|nr:thiamine phosphate synthase [Oceanibaculum indicum]